MTQFITFAPNNQAPFTTQFILDGETYSATVTWNLFGRRYYLNVYSLGGVLIFSLPLIGSGYGTILQTLSWLNGVVTAVTIDPITKTYAIGETVRLSIYGTDPDGYNGMFDCLITGPNSFTYELETYPGAIVTAGSANQNVNLAAGYFDSTIIFREANSQFEVNP